MQPPLSHQAAVLTHSKERAAEERERDCGARVLKERGKERQMAQMEVRKQTHKRQEEAGQGESK